MKRTEPVIIGELLSDIINSSDRLKAGFAESRVPLLWREVVGSLAGLTKDVYLRDGVLWVVCESSAARSEIMMRKSSLIAELNNLVGMNVVSMIRVK